MFNLDCSEIPIEGNIVPVFGRTTIGVHALYHRDYGCILASILIGDRRERGFFLGREDSHPSSLLVGYQMKIPIWWVIESDEMVIPTLLGMIQNLRFYFRPYEGGADMTELVVRAAFYSGGYREGGVWANHTFSPFGKEAAPKLSRLLTFFSEADFLTMESLRNPPLSIGAH